MSLKFQPLCWIYHDTWKWKETKIIVNPKTGEVADLSKIYTHPGHVHLFFDGKDVSKMTNTKAYSGTQDYHFEIQDIWGPDSKDKNQIKSYKRIGNPIWYIYVEEYWRRMYVQSWDYDMDFKNDIHNGKGGIKYDASKPCHTLGPFRQGGELYFFNTSVNRTLPIEYYLDKDKSSRMLYVKDDSNSNNTSGGQVWHFSKNGEMFNWMAYIWMQNNFVVYWYYSFDSAEWSRYTQYTVDYQNAKNKGKEYWEQYGQSDESVSSVDDCYGIASAYNVEQLDLNSASNSGIEFQERHHPQWKDGNWRGYKRTSRIPINDIQQFSGMNAKRIKKDGYNLKSNPDVYWQAYSDAFNDKPYWDLMKGDSSGNCWNVFTHFYNRTEWEAWKSTFENWQKNKLSYRTTIDYGQAKASNWDDGYSYVKDLAESNAYSYDITWTVNQENIINEDSVKYPSNSWYDIIHNAPRFPKYTYTTPTPLPQDYQSDYDNAFDNNWLGYYEYREIVKYKGNYYRRMWKPKGYEPIDFGYNGYTNSSGGDNPERERKQPHIIMTMNKIDSQIINQAHFSTTNGYDNAYNYQYSLYRRRAFPNPPPDGLPYDGNPEHDMYWEYMNYFGKANGLIENYYDYYYNYRGNHTVSILDDDSTNAKNPPDINEQTLQYYPPTWNSNSKQYDYRNEYHRFTKWFEQYRVLWGQTKYGKIDISRFTEEQINQWSNSTSVPYADWNESEKSACFNQYLNILHQQIIQSGYVGGQYCYYTGAFFPFEQAYKYWDGRSWHFRYQNPNFQNFELFEVIMASARPTYLQFQDFCNIWQKLSDNEVARLNLQGDMPELRKDFDSNSLSSCFNINNPLDPFTLSNSAITAWERKYTHREIYTIPESTFCKGDVNVGQGLHPYWASYSEEDGARTLYPDDKFISPIIEYQKVIHKDWELFNPNTYDILKHQNENFWRNCKPEDISTDSFAIDVSIPFVNSDMEIQSPFSDNQDSPTSPIGVYHHEVVKDEDKMRYHVEYYDSLAQVRKYDRLSYIKLIQKWNASNSETFNDDILSNVTPSYSDEMTNWFQSLPEYFKDGMPIKPVIRRNDEDTHAELDPPFDFISQNNTFDEEGNEIIVSNSHTVNSLYVSPLTKLCVTSQQIESNSDSNTYWHEDINGNIITSKGKVVQFNNPYGNSQDGKWMEQCLGAMVKAKAVIILEDRLGHRWFEEVTTTELNSDTPLRGSDY